MPDEISRKGKINENIVWYVKEISWKIKLFDKEHYLIKIF
jgi:hypothetical protein